VQRGIQACNALRLGKTYRSSHNAVNFQQHKPISQEKRNMPSLFRFLFAAGLLAGIGLGGLYVLAVFLEPVPKEVTKTIPNVKVRRN
jgi:hypothetical protein